MAATIFNRDVYPVTHARIRFVLSMDFSASVCLVAGALPESVAQQMLSIAGAGRAHRE